MRIRHSLLLLALSMLFACQVKVFDDLKDEAAISSLKPPDTYPRATLGRVMSAYVGQDMFGSPIARVVAAGGPGTPQVFFNIWNDGALGELNALDTRCNDGDCEVGISGDLAGLPLWDGMRDCYLVSAVVPARMGPSDGEGTLRVVCEQLSVTIRRTQVPGVDLGRSLAALPEGHPAGVALIGAPGGDGTLFRLVDAAPGPVSLPMPVDLVLDPGARFGEAVEIFAAPSLTGLSESVTVAVAAPGMSRVIVMEVGTADSVLESRLVGCIDDVDVRAPFELQGGAIAMGDVGTGPMIFVSTPDNGVDGFEGSIRAVSLANLAATPGCASSAVSDDAASMELNCDGAEGAEEVECQALGRGLVVGDINGDGFGDLLAGAPQSLVGGKHRGTLVMYPGSAAGLGMVRTLSPSSLGEDALFGQSVELATTGLGTANERLEPVVAAPGKTKLFILFCTGLDGDIGVDGDRCLPSES